MSESLVMQSGLVLREGYFPEKVLGKSNKKNPIENCIS